MAHASRPCSSRLQSSKYCSRSSYFSVCPLKPTRLSRVYRVSRSRSSSSSSRASLTMHRAVSDSSTNGEEDVAPDLWVQVQAEQAMDILAPFDQLPLHNKHILITAPRQYASKLAGLFITAGAQPVWLPGVAISRLVEQTHLQQLDDALCDLSSYTHLAFTSKNGILAVLERLQHLKGGAAAAAAYVRSSGIKLCALGADGQVLQEAGLQVDVSPAEASTKGLAAELAVRGQAQGARVLCPVPHVTGGLVEPAVVPRFIDAMTAAGAAAVRVPAYLTTPGLAGPGCCTAEAGLLQAGHIDAIAFSSTAEAQGLCQLLGGREALVGAIQQHGVVLAAHGPYTAAGASEVLGVPVPVVSQNFSTFHGLVAALAEAL